MASLPSRSQSPGCGTVSPSRISLRTSQGSTYDSPVLSEPKPLAAIFPGTTMPPSCPSPSSPTDGTQVLGGGVGRLGSTLSLIEGRGVSGSPLRSGMTAVPQHYGSTLPRQSQPLAYGADPYGLYQRSALPRPDSLIGRCDLCFCVKPTADPHPKGPGVRVRLCLPHVFPSVNDPTRPRGRSGQDVSYHENSSCSTISVI